jgi:hypothetical protein
VASVLEFCGRVSKGFFCFSEKTNILGAFTKLVDHLPIIISYLILENEEASLKMFFKRPVDSCSQNLTIEFTLNVKGA